MTFEPLFVIHVMVLPAALMGLAGLHLFPVPGKLAPPVRSVAASRRSSQDRLFLPDKSGKTLSGMVAVFLCICSLAFGEPIVLLEEATDPGWITIRTRGYFRFCSSCYV